MNEIIQVTVIMPSLNVAPYIKQCIESVCNQSLKDIEILCVDAGSTDGTLEILEEYAKNDSRIQVIYSERKSYGYQMNLGLSKARGEYISIVETDDFADTDMLEKLYSTAISKNADVVKANYYCHSRGEDDYFELFAGLPYERVIKPYSYLSLLMRPPSIWSGIYKRSFLEDNEIHFLETPGASFQDTSFILKVWISAERVCLLRSAFLHYRVDNPNSSVKSIEKIFYVRDEMLSAHEFLDRKPEKKQQYQGILWDHEAETYEWNFRRLSDELKYEFLQGVQERFREGISKGLYIRQYMRWPVWRMVLEVAEDPLIYLQGQCRDAVFNQLIDCEGVEKPSQRQLRRWRQKEKAMLIPQTLLDVVNYAKNYGISYCIQRVVQNKKSDF